IQVVTALGIAVAIIPGGAVAGTEVHQVRPRIVENRIPHRAAAAELPPLPAPGARGLFHRRILETVLGIARHGVEAPVELARLRVISAEVTPHAVLTAGFADQHLPVGHTRRAGDRIVLAPVDGQYGPGLLARAGIDSHQATIERAQVDLAVPGGDAAIDDAAAHVADPLSRGLGVVFPELFAAAGIERVHLAPGGGDVQDAVDVQRGAVLAQVGIVVGEPDESELLHV